MISVKSLVVASERFALGPHLDCPPPTEFSYQSSPAPSEVSSTSLSHCLGQFLRKDRYIGVIRRVYDSSESVNFDRCLLAFRHKRPRVFLIPNISDADIVYPDS